MAVQADIPIGSMCPPSGWCALKGNIYSSSRLWFSWKRGYQCLSESMEPLSRAWTALLSLQKTWKGFSINVVLEGGTVRADVVGLAAMDAAVHHLGQSILISLWIFGVTNLRKLTWLKISTVGAWLLFWATHEIQVGVKSRNGLEGMSWKYSQVCVMDVQGVCKNTAVIGKSVAQFLLLSFVSYRPVVLF